MDSFNEFMQTLQREQQTPSSALIVSHSHRGPAPVPPSSDSHSHSNSHSHSHSRSHASPSVVSGLAETERAELAQLHASQLEITRALEQQVSSQANVRELIGEVQGLQRVLAQDRIEKQQLAETSQRLEAELARERERNRLQFELQKTQFEERLEQQKQQFAHQQQVLQQQQTTLHLHLQRQQQIAHKLVSEFAEERQQTHQDITRLQRDNLTLSKAHANLIRHVQLSAGLGLSSTTATASAPASSSSYGTAGAPPAAVLPRHHAATTTTTTAETAEPSIPPPALLSQPQEQTSQFVAGPSPAGRAGNTASNNNPFVVSSASTGPMPAAAQSQNYGTVLEKLASHQKTPGEAETSPTATATAATAAGVGPTGVQTPVLEKQRPAAGSGSGGAKAVSAAARERLESSAAAQIFSQFLESSGGDFPTAEQVRLAGGHLDLEYRVVILPVGSSSPQQKNNGEGIHGDPNQLKLTYGPEPRFEWFRGQEGG
jgi:hypothetical protein